MLLPLGLAPGVGTALLGKHAAMACHTAVETAISDHYNDQIRDIHAKNMAEDEELRQVLLHFFFSLCVSLFCCIFCVFVLLCLCEMYVYSCVCCVCAFVHLLTSDVCVCEC